MLCVGTGAVLLGAGVLGGYCVYGLASFLYYAIYPPVRTASQTLLFTSNPSPPGARRPWHAVST